MKKIISILMAFALVLNLFGKSFGNNQKLQKNVDEINIYESYLNKKTQKMSIKAIDALSKKLVYADSIDLSNMNEEEIRKIYEPKGNNLIGFRYEIKLSIENGIKKNIWHVTQRNFFYKGVTLYIQEDDVSREQLYKFRDRMDEAHKREIEFWWMLGSAMGATIGAIYSVWPHIQKILALIPVPNAAITALLIGAGIIVAASVITKFIYEISVISYIVKDLAYQFTELHFITSKH